MQRLDLSTAKDKILADIRRYIAEVQRITKSPVDTVEDGIRTLIALRKTSYEDLNQIQHEYAALCAVHWLIARGVLGLRGALGTDTFGPDPGTDASFRESSLVFHRHRIDLENLTDVGALPPTGSWIVVGGPRNSNGSGSPATIYGFVP